MRAWRMGAAAITLAVALAPAQGQELRGALAKIKSSGEIVIGHRDAALPYAYLDRTQNLVGYSIDVCQQVIKEVRAAVGAEVKARYVSTTAQTRIPLLANGTVDIDCGNATQTLARSRQVDFSLPIYFWNERLLALKSSPVKDFTDLGGKVVAVIQGTTSDIYVTSLVESKKSDFRILRVRENPEAVLAVTTGRADVYYGDEVIFAALIKTSPDRDKLHIVGTPLTGNAIALMVRQDDSPFRLAVNTAITKLIRSGDLFKLIDKWFGDLGIALDARARAAYELQAISN